jgi:hypothetical protein
MITRRIRIAMPPVGRPSAIPQLLGLARLARLARVARVAALAGGVVGCVTGCGLGGDVGAAIERRAERTVERAPAEYSAAPRMPLVRHAVMCDSAARCDLGAQVSGVLLGDGQLALAGSTHGIAIFDASGQEVAPVGSMGAGTEQYLSAAGLRSVGSGDATFLVLDIAGLRVVRLTRAGRVQSTDPIAPQLHLAGVRAWPGGVVTLVIPRGDSVGGVVTGTFSVQRHGAAGTSAALLQVPATTVDVRGDLQPLPTFFSTRSTWDLGADGLVVYASGRDDRLVLIAPSGAVRAVVRTAIPARPVGPADLAAEQALIVSRFAPSSYTPGALAPAVLAQKFWYRDGVATAARMARRAAKTFPAISDVAVGQDGSIWLREGTTTLADSARWNVFDAGLTWRGWTSLPGRARILAADATRVLTAEPKWVSRGSWVRGEHAVLYLVGRR